MGTHAEGVACHERIYQSNAFPELGGHTAHLDLHHNEVNIGSERE